MLHVDKIDDIFYDNNILEFWGKLMNQLNREFTTNKKRKIDIYSMCAMYLLIGTTVTASYMIWHYYSYGQWAMDGAMQSFMRNIRATWLDSAFRVITSTSETLPVIIATLLIIISLIIYKNYKEAGIVAAYMLGVWRLNDFLKTLLHRPRIDASQHLVDISRYSHGIQFSLPSGHSMNFMALVLLGLYFIWIYSKNKKLNVGLTVLMLVYALLVGISRVYLNVHYFSDVITGWSVGIACAAITIIIHRLICSRQSVSNN
jgi:undecaprenyl-diphosphatase